MQQKLRQAFGSEMDQAIHLYANDELDSAFYHLERAHILGQSYIFPHTRSHWWMLKVGFKRGHFREVFGQMSRIIASILFSKIWVPLGNTGGSNVNPVQPMPIPDDLKKLLDKHS
ncbi:DUF3703 domain-containing protein [Shewanella sp. D64]|uniref:DUF3703 domain-containing protein n=1 Tax=unclassified Shewanella TaxID=196818 RepID=UPI0022BA4D26|nr:MULTISPECIES: DUF3703 domain-containing protein [unclassified Shewanella]MEC4725006.1 DUF3703 domain-containing protein [Shewanella sp. D64]MEC4736907.1 DUF3703 domain-containing protein [Shewanella sp. E94]WBJ96503.1 DUF3703 domain-containing protein [Shewanella sp. MTB7]